MANHCGTAETMAANAMVAARLLNLRLDPSFQGEEMQAYGVMNSSLPGENMQACDVIENGGEGTQPEQQHRTETPPRKVAPINDSNTDSDNDETRKNKLDELIDRLQCALQDLQTSVFEGAWTDLDVSLAKVKLHSLESFWYECHEFGDCDGELNEFDEAALDRIGTYVELKDDVDSLYGDGDQYSKVVRMLKRLGKQEIWMTRDFLGAVRQRADDQAYGVEVLREFYGEDYW